MHVWQMNRGGIWVPPPIGPMPIPPSPPAEKRKKREDEIRRQIVPIRCPGIAPAAWREVQQMMPGILNSQLLGANGPVITAPTSFWRLSDTADSAGSNTLTNNNTVTFSTGKIGNAAYMVGASNQFLSRATNSTLATGGKAFSCSVWFWPNDAGAGGSIAYKDASGQREWQLRHSTAGSGQVEFIIIVGGSAKVGTGDRCTGGAWNLLIGTFDGASTFDRTLQLSNGTVYTTNTGGPTTSGTAPFCLGGIAAFSFQFDGRVDACGWWLDYILTAGECTGLWNSGNGTEYTGTGWTP